MQAAPPLRMRRAVVLAATLIVPIALVWGLGHRGVHMARSLVLPGAGLVGERTAVAVVCFIAAVAATIAWVRWGLDWLLAGVVAASVVASGALSATHEHAAVAAIAAVAADTMRPVLAAHEFPLVVLVVGLISWVRMSLGRIPGLAWLGRRRNRTMRGLADIGRLGVVERSRTAAVLALVGDPALTDLARSAATDPAVLERARRVGLAARWRHGGDPLRVDHAPTRAALALTGALDDAALAQFVADAQRAPLGVPCSEPTWARPLDGVLAAIAVHRAGGSTERFRAALHTELGLRRGHRPLWWWTPLGIGAGAMPAWEHAACAGLARWMGWIDDRDWDALRQRALGASARGTGHPHDERLVAASRIWMVLVDDEPTRRLLERPTIAHDPLAVALAHLARAVSGEGDSQPHRSQHRPHHPNAVSGEGDSQPHRSPHGHTEVTA